jgi:hypothetical protein
LRRIKLILVGIMMLILLSGCNLKEKISENITEGIIEKAAGGEVDVEINGDDVSYTTEDGEVTIDEDAGVNYEGEDGTVIASGGEYEWPVDQAAVYLPKLENGTITYLLNGPDACMLIVEDLTMEDYKSYKEAITGAGFTTDSMDSSAEDLEIYSGTSSEGIIATISYTESEGTIQITLDASGI